MPVLTWLLCTDNDRLVAVGQPLPFLEKWVETMGRNAGILLQTTAELDVLYAHLRQIFVVTDEEGQEYFFRYYDPRVIRTFLPTYTASELEEFFGVVDRWIGFAHDGRNLPVPASDRGAHRRAAGPQLSAGPVGAKHLRGGVWRQRRARRLAW